MALRDQFTRRWRLLRALEGGGAHTAEELLALLGGDGGGHAWSARTLRRDLSHLIRSGFPLEGVRSGRKMRYRLLESYRASVPAPLRPSEWAALYFALSLMRRAPASPLAEEPLGPSLGGIFARLRDFVPPTLRAYAEGIEPRYAGVIASLREQGRQRRTGEALSGAIAQGRPVRMLAARPGEMRRRWWRVDPYLLGYEGGGFHLLGREAERGSLEVWHLEGVESVRAERGAFQLPLGLDLRSALAERLREARGEGCRVRLRFHGRAAVPEIAAYLEEAFGPVRIARSGTRGGEVVVRASDLWGLRRWVMAFGAEAEVVSPKELRRALAQELEGALKRYGKAGDGPPRTGPK